MNSKIQIVEKPDWVSWDDIHEVLWTAHAENRNNGVVMRYPSLSGEEIKNKIEANGKMFCAIVNGKLAGTAAIMTKKVKYWYNKVPETIAYLCFASVLPEYAGKGIYKQLNMTREKEARSMGYKRIMFDTHENNIHKIQVDKNNGFKLVDYKLYGEHYNVVMVKWIDGCPYSEIRIKYEFAKRKATVKIKRLLKKILMK